MELIAQCADALQAAHAAGVIHRDVKPSNILISETAGGGVRAQLTDFGIGHVVAAETLAGITRSGFTQTLTDTGATRTSGTFLYLAPEILRGAPATPSSDVYALSVVLFQLLAGDLQQPVTADWARRISDETLRADLSRGLASDSVDRFASAEEFREALRTLPARRAANRTQVATTEKTLRRQRLTRQVMTAAACLVVGGVALKLFEGNPATGELLINSDPAGAQVWQGEKKIGVTPFAVRGLKPGMVEYTLTADGFDSCTIFAKIEAGRTLAWQMPMRRLGAAQNTAAVSPPPRASLENPAPRGGSVPIPVGTDVPLVPLLPSPPVPQPAAEIASEIVDITGIVEIKPQDGAWSLVKSGQALSPGDRVRTGKNARVSIHYSDGTVVRVGQQTLFEMTPRAEAGGMSELQLQKGSVYFFNRERPKDVKIRTAAANGALRG